MSLEFRNTYVYHVDGEISHSKCHFSHPGKCTRNPYLHILKKCKLHSKHFFKWQVLDRCADNGMRVQLAGCDKMLKDVNLKKF